FSYLYLGNVLGAATGALLTALVLVEVLGFSETLSLAATCNAAIAVASIGLGLRDMLRPASAQSSEPPEPSPALTTLPELPPASGQTTLFLLFITGFSSMAMEVVWTRAFTPITQTTIYAFALLLSTYLFATAAGSL